MDSQINSEQPVEQVPPAHLNEEDREIWLTLSLLSGLEKQYDEANINTILPSEAVILKNAEMARLNVEDIRRKPAREIFKEVSRRAKEKLDRMSKQQPE